MALSSIGQSEVGCGEGRACASAGEWETSHLALRVLRDRPSCYADVMSIKRITISVPDEVANRIKKAAGDIPVSA